MSNELPIGSYERGLEKGKEMLGSEYFAERMAHLRALDPDFERLMVSFIHGGMYSRSVLDQGTRELCAISGLVCIGAEDQLRIHCQVALKSGIDQRKVLEAILQMSVYAGFARVMKAVEIFHAASEGIEA
jgi:4-carboxymuconolactone decarboxylase